MIKKLSIFLLSTLLIMSSTLLGSAQQKKAASGHGPHVKGKFPPVTPAIVDGRVISPAGSKAASEKDASKENDSNPMGLAALQITAETPVARATPAGATPAGAIPPVSAIASTQGNKLDMQAVALAAPTAANSTSSAQANKDDLLEFPEGNGLSNWWYGTHKNVLSFMRENMVSTQRLNPDSAYNQKVLASAVANLVKPDNESLITEFLSLASTQKLGKPTAKIDPTVRRQLRGNCKSRRAKKMEDLFKKLHEQAELTKAKFTAGAKAVREEYEKNMAELAKIYSEGVADTNGLSNDIDRTYELADRSVRNGADSDNEESHPSFVEPAQLVGVKPENLITTQADQLIAFKALEELFKLKPSSKNKASIVSPAAKK